MNKCVYLTFILKSQICVNYDLKQLLNISIRIDDIILGTYWLNVSIWLNNNNGFIIVLHHRRCGSTMFLLRSVCLFVCLSVCLSTAFLLSVPKPFGRLSPKLVWYIFRMGSFIIHDLDSIAQNAIAQNALCGLRRFCLLCQNYLTDCHHIWCGTSSEVGAFIIWPWPYCATLYLRKTLLRKNAIVRNWTLLREFGLVHLKNRL